MTEIVGIIEGLSDIQGRFTEMNETMYVQTTCVFPITSISTAV